MILLRYFFPFLTTQFSTWMIFFCNLFFKTPRSKDKEAFLWNQGGSRDRCDFVNWLFVPDTWLWNGTYMWLAIYPVSFDIIWYVICGMTYVCRANHHLWNDIDICGMSYWQSATPSWVLAKTGQPTHLIYRLAKQGHLMYYTYMVSFKTNPNASLFRKIKKVLTSLPP